MTAYADDAPPPGTAPAQDVPPTAPPPAPGPDWRPEPAAAPEPAPAAAAEPGPGQAGGQQAEGQQAEARQAAAPQGERRGPRPQGPKDTVFIGKKPLMAYVTSTLLQLAETPSVTIKARGMSISRAVDVAQIISRKRDNAGYAIDGVTLGSETLESTDGKKRNVSTITIAVRRN